MSFYPDLQETERDRQTYCVGSSEFFTPGSFRRQQRGKTMRKLFTIFPLCIVLCLLTGGCFTADANEENYEEEIATVSYDNNTDYMSLMVQYAAAGNMDALGAAVTARNEKIANHLRISCRMKTVLKLLCGCSMGSVSSTMVQLFFRQTFGRAVARTSNCMTSN